MGIKGIYAEIGPGRRVSLAKLASDKLTESRRPFRLAVDFSIWEFQNQAAKGGTNPALRTLFYRLSRLLGLGIRPIFVFDGPKKPAFKRNKRSFRSADTLSVHHAKKLISLFGFRVHDAPGEAEAECAILQRHGIVDAVLSEDIDTVMFGCTSTIRSWSSEGSSSNKTPTHITLYTTEPGLAGTSGLDRHGLVLVALMSGGDYVPEGIPGCGIKVACEAARANFGKELCDLELSDSDGLRDWRERLAKELQTNESGFFKTRHMALKLPDNFPDMGILLYYTRPVVSKASDLERLKRDTVWGTAPNLDGLRAFAEEMFDWKFPWAVVKFIRRLCPALLVHQLLTKHTNPSTPAVRTESSETIDDLLGNIMKQRSHANTDKATELRVGFVPGKLLGHGLCPQPKHSSLASSQKGIISEDKPGTPADSASDNSDDEKSDAERYLTELKPWDMHATWILKAVIQIGAPVRLMQWEEQEASRNSLAALSSRKISKGKKSVSTASNPDAGSILKFLKPIPPAPDEVSCGYGGLVTGALRTVTDSIGPQHRLFPSKQSKLAPASENSKSIRGTRVLEELGLQISPRTPIANNRKKELFVTSDIVVASSAPSAVSLPPSTPPITSGTPKVAPPLTLVGHGKPSRKRVGAADAYKDKTGPRQRQASILDFLPNAKPDPLTTGAESDTKDLPFKANVRGAQSRCPFKSMSTPGSADETVVVDLTEE